MSKVGDLLGKGMDSLKSFSPLAQVKEGAVEIVSNLASKGTELFTQVQEGKITIEQAKIELEKFKIDSQHKQEQNITDRWVADSQSKGWLKNNIRPLALAWALGNATIMIYLDSLDWFTVDEKWIPLLTQLLITIVGGYFVLRSTFDKRKSI